MLQKLVSASVVIALLIMCGIGNAQGQKKRTGTIIGELKSIKDAPNKRDTIIEVLAPAEEKARRYHVGAQQKTLVAAVRAAKVGDRVEIDWFDTNEGLCVEKFRVLKKEKSQ